MKNENNEKARFLFAKQLMRYRLAYRLSRTRLAGLVDTNRTYIIKLENAELNVGVDNMEKFSDFFEVKIYEMLNPYFPVQLNDQIAARISKFRDSVKKYAVDKPKQPRTKLSPFLDELLATPFLKEPRTLAEIAEALAGKVAAAEGRIAVLLGKHPRNKLVRTLPGEEWGGKVNKYVLI
ncbi:Helix-turn-helix [bacterium A37T11]|nr:Helix-turn-helix [bacterium A37T11]